MNGRELVNDFLGEKFIKSFDQGQIDFFQLPVVDADILNEAKLMSDEYLLKRAQEYEEKADELEEKIHSGRMTSEEKAEYDRNVPFSLQAHDTEIKKIKMIYQAHKNVLDHLNSLTEEQREEEGMTDGEYEELKRHAEISPELEAAYQKINEKEEMIFRKTVEVEKKAGLHDWIGAEDMDEIIQKVINREDIEETPEETEAFFEEMWGKI